MWLLHNACIANCICWNLLFVYIKDMCCHQVFQNRIQDQTISSSLERTIGAYILFVFTETSHYIFHLMVSVEKCMSFIFTYLSVCLFECISQQFVKICSTWLSIASQELERLMMIPSFSPKVLSTFKKN